MALYTCSFISPSPPSLFAPVRRSQPLLRHRRVSYSNASVGSSSSEPKASSSSSSSSSSPPPQTTPSFPSATTTSSSSSTSTPFVESRPPDPVFNYAFASPNGNPAARFFRSTESNIERLIFDFRFLALFAVGGSLAGSLLCFLNGCIYIVDAYKVYWSSCVRGVHSGKMVLRLVEAIDVYLAGTVMLIFGMGLYGLFISSTSPDEKHAVDRALVGSSLFGMFVLKVFLGVRFKNILVGREKFSKADSQAHKFYYILI